MATSGISAVVANEVARWENWKAHRGNDSVPLRALVRYLQQLIKVNKVTWDRLNPCVLSEVQDTDKKDWEMLHWTGLLLQQLLYSYLYLFIFILQCTSVLQPFSDLTKSCGDARGGEWTGDITGDFSWNWWHYQEHIIHCITNYHWIHTIPIF